MLIHLQCYMSGLSLKYRLAQSRQKVVQLLSPGRILRCNQFLYEKVGEIVHRLLNIGEKLLCYFHDLAQEWKLRSRWFSRLILHSAKPTCGSSSSKGVSLIKVRINRLLESFIGHCHSSWDRPLSDRIIKDVRPGMQMALYIHTIKQNFGIKLPLKTSRSLRSLGLIRNGKKFSTFRVISSINEILNTYCKRYIHTLIRTYKAINQMLLGRLLP
jgi:hypothetical protein